MKRFVKSFGLIIVLLHLPAVGAKGQSPRQSAVAGERIQLPGEFPLTPGGINLWGVDILHRDTAIAVGDAGAIKKTGDGGFTRETRYQAGSRSNILLRISYVDSQTATAV